jgi:glycerol-3-phosphate dehydrogenase
MNRAEKISHLRKSPEVSVLIIGGGINGIGVFRDLALQGVDVLLVERKDFCSGASAASSHMVHGGIRYLENGEFRLVREAVQERNRLLENAPHYVKPLPTTIPIFKWFSGIFNAPLKFLGWLDKPAERGALVIKIGLQLYDAYTRQQGRLPRHRFLSRKASLERFPDLNPEILCTATYFDAAMYHPERLCIELLLDAEAANPQAMALNYISVVAADRDTVTLETESGERLWVKPAVVINAAGPWVDLTNRKLGPQTHFIGGTKGSHLVLDNPQLRAAIKEHEFFFENKDGRIVLIYPLADRVLVGTSDIPWDDPNQARCTEEEVDYFLEMIARVFPKIAVNRQQIVFRFSGVRPLPYTSASTPGQISRDHSIRQIEADAEYTYPIYCLIGGKWTTFRAFAEQVTDVVLERLGKPRLTSTRKLPIGGGVNYPHEESDRETWLQSLHRETGVPLPRLRTLFDRYGTRAAEAARFICQNQDTPLRADTSYSTAEIAFLAQQEAVVHLEDLILRRTNLAKLGYLTSEGLLEFAEALASAMGWSAKVTQAEIDRCRQVLANRHQVVP